MDLRELRKAVTDAAAQMRTANEAIEAADPNAEGVDLDALERSFEGAEAEHRNAKKALQRAESVEEARKNAPIDPVADDVDEQVEERKGEVRVGKEPLTYEKHSQHNFLTDLYQGTLAGNSKAQERLNRHRDEMRAEGHGEERALSSTDSEGGYLVAPLYLQDEFVKLARAARPTANAVRGLSLPPKTDSINVPKMSTGTAVEGQKDNESVKSTDATFGTLEAPVRTIAGQQDFSRQLFDRSVPAVEEIILADLAAAYATKVDTEVLSGSGTAPHVKGILSVSGINEVAYTDASPTVAELYPKIASAINEVHTKRFLPPTGIIMHPRRWAWFLAATDSTGRPLVTPYAPMNAAGLTERVGSENVVGELQGLPVIVDPSIPTTEKIGEAETFDPIIVARLEDIYLWEEGDVNRATYFEVLSGTLGVRVQVYGYLAFLAERYKSAITKISGTGLTTPTF